jgi:hypothetical protein
MSEDKARDDKFINKDEPHEIDFILDQYEVKDHIAVMKAIEAGNYLTHKELYDKLARQEIQKK